MFPTHRNVASYLSAFADTVGIRPRIRFNSTVTKVARANSTETAVRAIDGEERVEEIARMLSGDPQLTSARTHAAELLAARPRGTNGKKPRGSRRALKDTSAL